MKINDVTIPAEISTIPDDALRAAVSHDNGPFDRQIALARLIELISQQRPSRGRKASGCTTEASARVTKHRLLSAVTAASGTDKADEVLDKAKARLSIDPLLQRILSDDELETACYTGNRPKRVAQQVAAPYSDADMSALGPGEYYNDDWDIVAAYSDRWYTGE